MLVINLLSQFFENKFLIFKCIIVYNIQLNFLFQSRTRPAYIIIEKFKFLRGIRFLGNLEIQLCGYFLHGCFFGRPSFYIIFQFLFSLVVLSVTSCITSSYLSRLTFQRIFKSSKYKLFQFL